MTKFKLTTRDMTLIAMFTAVTAVLSQITIPLGFTPIPINFATLAVLLAGGLLGGTKGAISQLVYLLVGVVGIPVFSGFRGGIGVLVGPTGGYIIGYVVGAFAIGLVIKKCGTKLPILICAMAAGMVVLYTTGTLWFMISTKNGLAESLMMCVVPFLIGDALKITAGAFLVKRLRRLTMSNERLTMNN